MNIDVIFNQDKKEHNFGLNSGERQVGDNLDKIRKDHVFRYAYAQSFIKNYFGNLNNHLIGADIFCGNGYGSYLLSKEINGCSILAVDGSSEAIDFAKKNYSNGDCINFKHFLYPFDLKRNYFDFIVSLESIEHISNDHEFLHTIYHALKHKGLLIMSTPDEELYPYETNVNTFHYRHYVFSNFILKMESLNFKLLDFAGQNVYALNKFKKSVDIIPSTEMVLTPKTRGQFNIFAFMLDL